ncbi:hypothetical protein Taro_004263 [Colocasia esculenta]|uniref:Uncharacterized protein n=1 Tax=Colocasia esculenta TaxID=4460 RepID=A0A843TPJ9_COLES|nr:hypothetical protein [Colocasia esculenta]
MRPTLLLASCWSLYIQGVKGCWKKAMKAASLQGFKAARLPSKESTQRREEKEKKNNRPATRIPQEEDSKAKDPWKIFKRSLSPSEGRSLLHGSTLKQSGLNVSVWNRVRLDQEVSKKAHEQLVERVRTLEKDLSGSRNDLTTIRLERDKAVLEAQFAKEKLDSYMKEFEHQSTVDSIQSADEVREVMLGPSPFQIKGGNLLMKSTPNLFSEAKVQKEQRFEENMLRKKFDSTWSIRPSSMNITTSKTRARGSVKHLQNSTLRRKISKEGPRISWHQHLS